MLEMKAQVLHGSLYMDIQDRQIHRDKTDQWLPRLGEGWNTGLPQRVTMSWDQSCEICQNQTTAYFKRNNPVLSHERKIGSSKRRISIVEEKRYENTIKLKCNVGKVNLFQQNIMNQSVSFKNGKDVALSLVVCTQEDSWRQEAEVKVILSCTASLRQPQLHSQSKAARPHPVSGHQPLQKGVSSPSQGEARDGDGEQ